MGKIGDGVDVSLMREVYLNDPERFVERTYFVENLNEGPCTIVHQPTGAKYNATRKMNQIVLKSKMGWTKKELREVAERVNGSLEFIETLLDSWREPNSCFCIESMMGHHFKEDPISLHELLTEYELVDHNNKEKGYRIVAFNNFVVVLQNEVSTVFCFVCKFRLEDPYPRDFVKINRVLSFEVVHGVIKKVLECVLVTTMTEGFVPELSNEVTDGEVTLLVQSEMANSPHLGKGHKVVVNEYTYVEFKIYMIE